MWTPGTLVHLRRLSGAMLVPPVGGPDRAVLCTVICGKVLSFGTEGERCTYRVLVGEQVHSVTLDNVTMDRHFVVHMEQQ